MVHGPEHPTGGGTWEGEARIWVCPHLCGKVLRTEQNSLDTASSKARPAPQTLGCWAPLQAPTPLMQQPVSTCRCWPLPRHLLEGNLSVPLWD